MSRIDIWGWQWLTTPGIQVYGAAVNFMRDNQAKGAYTRSRMVFSRAKKLQGIILFLSAIARLAINYKYA